MQEIIDKHEVESTSLYLLPILKYPYERSRKQYKNVLFRVNKHLKEVARLANIGIPLDDVCQPAFVGKRGKEQEHSCVGHQRRHGA